MGKDWEDGNESGERLGGREGEWGKTGRTGMRVGKDWEDGKESGERLGGRE